MARETSLAVLAGDGGRFGSVSAKFWSLARSARYKQFVTAWLGVFCAGFTLFSWDAEQRWLFYIAIPLALPAVVDAWRRLAGGVLFWSITGFLLYSAISALWSGHWLTVGDELRRAFWIEYFLLICCWIGESGTGWLRHVLQAAALFAAAVALYAVVVFFLHCDGCARFAGLGARANSNVTASMFGTLALLGLAAGFSAASVPPLLLLASQAPLCALLIATGSRAALVAYLAGSLACLVLVPRRSSRLQATGTIAVALGSIAAAVAVAAVFGPDWLHMAIARGDTLRLQIWSENLHRVAEHPWFGHGVTAPDIVSLESGEIIGLHAHNLFLAQAFYGGAAGCALWLTVFAAALRVGWRALRTRGELLPLVPLGFLLMVGDVDIGPVVLDVQPVWLYVWVVLGIALAYDVDLRRATTSR